MQIFSPKKLPDLQITSVTADSRMAKPGALFVAVRGLTVDGHDYVDDAVARGCTAVLVDKKRGAKICKGLPITCLSTANTQQSLGEAAAALQGYPADKMTLIGITGTNGKTTTTYLLESMIRQSGGNPGVIGTVNYRYNEKVLPAPFTTPDSVALQKLLREMAEAKVSHVIMEVSSHALAQKRLSGVRFDLALFTNLTRDHLDFHGSMQEYFESKKLLFTEHLKEKGQAVIVAGKGEETGADWPHRLAEDLKKILAGRITVCGIGEGDLHVDDMQLTLTGTSAKMTAPDTELQIFSDLVGGFNVNNLLGAAGVGRALGLANEAIEQGLAKAVPAPGRLEKVSSRAGINVFVDYAHTPDALEHVLLTLRNLGRGRLIAVFGCGGDRDQGKRPLMGRVAARWADVTVLTSDNPRSEDPLTILANIEQGLLNMAVPRMRLEALIHQEKISGYDIIADRREAIRAAIRYAAPGDIVAICGKGHEDYQITRNGKIFFDDRLEASREGGVVHW